MNAHQTEEGKHTMTTSEEIRVEALRLANEGVEPKEAALLLLDSAERRVPVVSAKRTLEVELSEHGGSSATAKALEIVNTMLAEGDWPE
jgi:hypothetical protein